MLGYKNHLRIKTLFIFIYIIDELSSTTKFYVAIIEVILK